MNLEKGQSKLDVMQRKISRMKEELSEEFKGVMHESFKDLFENHPNIKSLSWQQFTPYFNDGDACYFSYYNLTDHTCIIEVDGEEIECYAPGYEHAWWKTKEGKSARKAVGELDSLISRFEDELQDVFGDHCEVIATKDGFDISEVDHY